MTLHRLATLPILALFLVTGSAGAASLKGVNAPDSVQVEGRTLALQGLGLRKQFLFSVYVAALYLATPTTEAAAAVAADEPKRIALHFLRDVGGEKMAEFFREGFFNNSQEKLDRLGPRLDTLVRLFAGGVRAGQAVALTYLPDRGVSVTFDGAEKGVLAGRDFMEALWAVWLGDVPADHDLKKGMLGGK